MKKSCVLAERTAKEILRDKLNLFFGLGFPLVLIFLLTAIGKNAPMELFTPEKLAPGAAVFGLSFLSLFSAVLVAKDRESAFLQRLYTAPVRAGQFIFGYAAPLVPMAAGQCALCVLAALALGAEAGWGMAAAVFAVIPAAVFYIALGVLCGSVMNSKQVGGVCGALLTNLSAWLSGVWFDVGLVGGIFEKIANALPFIHAVEMTRAVFSGNWAGIFPHIWWVTAYAAAAGGAAVWMFLRQMKK